MGNRRSFTRNNGHLDRQHPSLYHMEDIAWILRTDTRRNQIGFVQSRDLKVNDRLFVDEE